MILDIPITADWKTMNCLETSAVAIAKWLGCRYELMFSKSWYFKFISGEFESSILGKRVIADETDVFSNTSLLSLEKYHGLKFVWHDICTGNELKSLDIILSELEKSQPVVITLNTYWCPWIPRYKKIINPGDGYKKNGVKRLYHTLIVVGYDVEKSCLYCRDNETTNVEILPINDYVNGCGPCAAIETANVKTEENWIYIIKEAVNNMMEENNSLNSFEQIRLFANEISNSMDLKKEIQGYGIDNIWASPLIRALNNIMRGRRKFALSLKYLNEKYNINDLAIYSTTLGSIGAQWDLVMDILVKGCLLSNPHKIVDRAAKEIMQISYNEEKVAQQLLQINIRTQP